VYNMRAFAAAWNGPELNCPDTVWTIELEPQRRAPEQAGCPRAASRVRVKRHGWSVAVLEHQILTSLHTRTGAAPNSLGARLPGEGTDLAREVAKDPRVLDFPGSDQGCPGTCQACPSNLSKLNTAS
jgi:hypothetical protein